MRNVLNILRLTHENLCEIHDDGIPRGDESYGLLPRRHRTRERECATALQASPSLEVRVGAVLEEKLRDLDLISLNKTSGRVTTLNSQGRFVMGLYASLVWYIQEENVYKQK